MRVQHGLVGTLPSSTFTKPFSRLAQTPRFSGLQVDLPCWLRAPRIMAAAGRISTGFPEFVVESFELSLEFSPFPFDKSLKFNNPFPFDGSSFNKSCKIFSTPSDESSEFVLPLAKLPSFDEPLELLWI
ncbi:Uncharacterized protein TCM_044798 [Theobroma cacao]|uniref:Uncharacterized protein n=1 Tax=Theobroma cacao TaxID=3641 RepID=A0A061FY11_THECC|nr:Uncharacterized protein TCM_044798 [Theobroma cacao]